MNMAKSSAAPSSPPSSWRRSRLRAAPNKPIKVRMAGAAAPGSQQDFVVNVGDRVFFETDSSELTGSGARDARQAGAVAQQLQPLRLHRRRSCRRARHARIQHRARRPPRRDGAPISGLARRAGAAHAHHLLRQGAAGRAVQRYFVLVAESPRRDGARSEFVAFKTSGAKQSAPSWRRLLFCAQVFCRFVS